MSGYQPMSFAQLLKVHREHVGFSEDDLAIQLQVSTELIRSVERGITPIPPELLVRWAEQVGTSPYFLAVRHMNEFAAKYCRRANLDAVITVSLTPSTTGAIEYGLSSPNI